MATQIPLTRGLFTLIDTEDLPRVIHHKWMASQSGKGKFYAATWSGKRIVLMHRLLLQCQRGRHVDHINGDTLDNRRSVNLRHAAFFQNQGNRLNLNRNNTTGYRGVCRKKKSWAAHITIDHQYRHLGTFTNPEDAARAYNEAALLRFGEFARLNEIKGAA